MKIYQIHESSGCYEDYHDYIRFTYLDPDKAIKKKEELEAQEEIEKMCDNCPLWFCPDDCPEDCETCDTGISSRVKRAKEYCNKCDAKVNEYEDLECGNMSSHWDDCSYSIEEVDVIE